MMSKKIRFNIVCAKNNLVILFIGISFWIICNMRGIIFWMNFWKKIILNKNLYNEYVKLNFCCCLEDIIKRRNLIIIYVGFLILYFGFFY